MLPFFQLILKAIEAVFRASQPVQREERVDEAGGIRVLLMPVEGDASGAVVSGIYGILSETQTFEVIRTDEAMPRVDDTEVLPSSLAGLVRKARQSAASHDAHLIICGHVTDSREFVRLRFIPARLDLDSVSTVILSGDMLEIPLSLTGMEQLITLASLASAYCDKDSTRRRRSDATRSLPQGVESLVGEGGGTLSLTGEASVRLYYAASLISAALRTDQKSLLQQSLSLTKDALAKGKDNLTAAQVAAARSRFALASSELAIRDEEFDKIEELVSHFRMSIETYPIELFPDENAFLNVQMAKALASLGQATGKMPILRSAVDAYFEASKSWVKGWRSESWAEVQSGMGNIMVQIGEFSGNSEILGRAAQVFESASRVWTREDYPKQWASLQNSIGACKFANGKRTKNLPTLREALECFSQALQVYTAQGMEKNVIVTQKNIARVERVLGTQEGGGEPSGGEAAE